MTPRTAATIEAARVAQRMERELRRLDPTVWYHLHVSGPGLDEVHMGRGRGESVRVRPTCWAFDHKGDGAVTLECVGELVSVHAAVTRTDAGLTVTSVTIDGADEAPMGLMRAVRAWAANPETATWVASLEAA